MAEQPPVGPDESRPDAAGPTGRRADQEAPDPLLAAHEALARARRFARARGLRPGAPAGAGRRREALTPESPRKDRDLHVVGEEIDKLLATRGWAGDVQVGSVVGRWADIVGPQVAEHVEVVAFEGTTLTVRASSTAWATQMRLLVSTVMGRIDETVGPGVVSEIVVHGPAGPSWRKGPLSSRGPGPRDTYG